MQELPSHGHQRPEENKLKSTAAPTLPAGAIFRNRTPRLINLLWLDFQGRQVTHTRNGLKSRHKMAMNTFEGHPWIFRDHITGDKLVCYTDAESQKREVFFPIPFSEDYPHNTQVNIILPVYTLKERALQVVRSYIRSKDDCAKLQIPTTLQCELANPDVSINW
ncbi:von Hippel-Lindau disease tumor suppressor-like [Asterias rubens]|uniref:von Hippel-Lindau disease tumor suppressor-like n=1 Tax=Asterias rubens TaxID=7604 RepID=UPI0014556DB7|nr:von Hippel-Lindau disease tumor suppressor-like [Asterias rubens]XP_033645016.1 von Hippel-Lindau disease tumor suppressor-like [Asterias rubens]XP_033645017.1 von Hippel-Lindau disease tumor suppressor-like [Asterias rubens]